MKLSIIVVAHNVELYIEKALNSCIAALDEEYEVIVVDNNSDDATLSLIRSVAAAHPNIFNVVENDTNVGLGFGRNIGMQHARGEYILFLDGDDWYSPTAITKCIDYLSKYSFDVLVFDHVRAYPSGRIVWNPASKILWEGYRNTPFERAEIIRNFGVAWNKLYRRAFIDEKELIFRNVYYEDIDWNFSCLFRANSYYVIPDTLVNYRQRPGSITKSASMRHFDIIGQYERVLVELSSHRQRQEFGPPAYRYARNQILFVLQSPERLPEEARAEFLVRAADFLARFRSCVDMGVENLLELALISRSSRAYFAALWVDRYLRRISRALRRAGTNEPTYRDNHPDLGKHSPNLPKIDRLDR